MLLIKALSFQFNSLHPLLIASGAFGSEGLVILDLTPQSLPIRFEPMLPRRLTARAPPNLQESIPAGLVHLVCLAPE